MKKQLLALEVAVVVLMGITSAQAGSVIWGNNASDGNVNLEAFDSATGLLIPGQQFLVPNVTAQADNGRGVALLGNDIYYTTAFSGNIYKTNVITHADLGIVVNTGFNGIANIATDGTFLYANDYQATNGVINKYTPAGVLVGSITLTGADAVGASSRDGFEVQNNPNILGGATTFIANRYDGGFGPTNGSVIGAYDVYDSTGVEIISGFITPNANGTSGATGIAYDGDHYFVSDIFNNRLFEYDGLGAFVGIIDLSANPNPPSGTRVLEDLSAVGNTVTNPGCGNNSVDAGEQCDGTADAACPGQCLPPGDPNQCTCESSDLCSGVVCAPLDQCHQAGTCDPQTRLCSNPAVEDGSPCGVGGSCVAGVCNQPPDCSNASGTPAELWPPNHKFVNVSVAGVTNPDGDTVSITITGVTQDEPLNSLGDGDTCPDATGVGMAAVKLRAERSGTGDGRVYHVSFSAVDGRGGRCQGAVTVCVPHDQRPGHVCGDQGPLVNSTGPCS